MKTNELRIGNLVNHIDKIIKIECLNPKDDDVNDEIPFHAIFGIPLTEEWLVRFGFLKKGIRFSKNGLLLWKENDLFIFSLFESDSETQRNTIIKHVNQLQNLYFALTNEELECNSK